MISFEKYIIAVATLLVLSSANIALASTTMNSDVAAIGRAPVGDDLSFTTLGGFFRFLGGFVRLGSATGSSDMTPPSAPTNLTVVASSSTEIDLSWTASTDNVGVAGYQIFRGGLQVGTTTSGTTDADTGLIASTTYAYFVKAYDAAKNVSASSNTATSTTGGFPGEAGNPVGYAAYETLGTTPWSGGSFVSGTSGSPTVYTGYVFTGCQTISGSYIEFIFSDFNAGTCGVSVTGSNITFIGDRFQSNDTGYYNVLTSGTNLTFSYDSFVPLVSLYTSPPGAAWPSAGAGMNTTTQTTNVNAINGNDGYQYGIFIQSRGPVTVDHSDIWGFGNSVDFDSSTTAQMNITNNWIHDAANASLQGYHTDGPGYLTDNGGPAPSNILIQGNTIASIANGNGIAFQAATSGYNNIQIIGNYLSGFGNTVDPGFPGSQRFSNSSFIDNVFGTDVQPAFGPLYGNDWTTGNGNVWKCNTINVASGTSWTDTVDPWTPVSGDTGLYWVSTSSVASTTDYLGNSSCPSAASTTFGLLL